MSIDFFKSTDAKQTDAFYKLVQGNKPSLKKLNLLANLKNVKQNSGILTALNKVIANKNDLNNFIERLRSSHHIEHSNIRDTKLELINKTAQNIASIMGFDNSTKITPQKQQSGADKVESTKTSQKTSSQKDVSAQHKGNTTKIDDKAALSGGNTGALKSNLKTTSGIQSTANNAKAEEIKTAKTKITNNIATLVSKKNALEAKVLEATKPRENVLAFVKNDPAYESIKQDLTKMDNVPIITKNKDGTVFSSKDASMTTPEYAMGIYGGAKDSHGNVMLDHRGKAFLELINKDFKSGKVISNLQTEIKKVQNEINEKFKELNAMT